MSTIEEIKKDYLSCIDIIERRFKERFNDDFSLGLLRHKASQAFEAHDYEKASDLLGQLIDRL